MAARQQGAANYAQMFGNAQQDIYNNMAQANMLDYQSRMAQDQARNQFFGSLVGAGTGLYGANVQANAMNANTAALQRQNQLYQGVPASQPYAGQPYVANDPYGNRMVG